jgi:predicted ribosome quality control (RQC) complex YloA/Tae2 family protein
MLAEENLRVLKRKADGLRREMADSGEAARIQTLGDLLLANLHRVPRGQPAVQLEDWEGNSREIALDAALSPAENAARYYQQARRKRRAEEQIPALLAKTELQTARWQEAAEAIDRGDVPDWVEEQLQSPRTKDAKSPDTAPGTPYRIFRTSGGLEVRVGRSSKENDHLTFRESSPNDIWLHAQSVPGSHVILRWPDLTASPPARDLEEAALLAAHYSRARTSGLVAVAWTRRKHVRKPRGAAPGLVIPQQTKTVLVRPEEEVEERLRWPRDS